MKIYFDIYINGVYKVTDSIPIYTSPAKNKAGYTGEGCHYTILGKKYRFSWVSPKTALVIDSKELPKEFVYSFKHGQEEVWIKDILKFEDITKESLIEAIKKDTTHYVTPKEVEEAKRIDDLINSGGAYTYKVPGINILLVKEK